MTQKVTYENERGDNVATNPELKVMLNKKLYDLRKLKKRNPGIEIIELDDMILET